MNIKQIDPYTKLELDCYQNLLATFLVNNNFDVDYIGAVWPWEFLIENEEKDMYKVESTEIITADTLKDIYNIKLIYKEDKDHVKLINEVKSYLDKDIPVIVGIDQYYVHYHYKYIYKKQHGIHSVIVTDINEEENLVNCVDAIPNEYKGTMPYEEFFEGVKAKSDPWYAVLEYPFGDLCVKKEQIFNLFVRKVKRAKEKYNNQIDESKLCYTPHILKIVNDIIDCEDLDNQLKMTEKLCDGVWGWQIDRKPMWTIEYLKTDYVKSKFSQWEECCELLEKNKKAWVAAYKYIFMATQSKKREAMLKGARDRLEKIVKSEEEIMNIILN